MIAFFQLLSERDACNCGINLGKLFSLFLYFLQKEMSLFDGFGRFRRACAEVSVNNFYALMKFKGLSLLEIG